MTCVNKPLKLTSTKRRRRHLMKYSSCISDMRMDGFIFLEVAIVSIKKLLACVKNTKVVEAMKYEHKDEIIMNLKDYNAGRKVTGGTHAFESKLEELDHVYSQAALNKEKIKQIEETYKVRYSEHIELKRKADEYEAKAEAFDDIREARKEVLTDVQARGSKLPADLDKFSLMTERIINDYERV